MKSRGKKTLNKIAVIIPYYQKKQGILQRALNSIAGQSDFEHIDEIVVIDDGSPIPAKDELKNLSGKLSVKITVLEQPNGGVSKARNAGLKYLANKATNIVAFLDSDDIWEPEHIRSMLLAFDQGADFYFSNFCQLNQTVGAFERAKRINFEDHLLIDDELYHYQGDMLEQILTGNLIGTPTVGYRFDKYSSLRFQENLSFAGEDYLFWLDIAEKKPKILFSKALNVVCLEGVNIFSSAKWGSKHLSLRLRDEICFRKKVLQSYTLTEDTRAGLGKKIKENQRSLIKNALSTVKNGDFSVVPLTFYFLLKYPKAILSLLKA